MNVFRVIFSLLSFPLIAFGFVSIEAFYSGGLDKLVAGFGFYLIYMYILGGVPSLFFALIYEFGCRALGNSKWMEIILAAAAGIFAGIIAILELIISGAPVSSITFIQAFRMILIGCVSGITLGFVYLPWPKGNKEKKRK